MKDTIDFRLLEFATKSKNFIAEIATQTREDFYSADIRIPLKIIKDYYNANKDIPSFEMISEYAKSYPNANKAIEILYEAYNSNKDNLVDGDFPQLVKNIKNRYNDAYVREKIYHLSHSLTEEYELEDINDRIKKLSLEIGTFKSEQTYSQGTLGESAKQRYLDYLRIEQNPELARGVMSGYKELDAITNGFRGCELILVTGPSGSGKSCLLMNMAVNAWLGNNRAAGALGLGLVPKTSSDSWDDSGKDVWFVTIENPRELQERRISSCVAGVSCNGIRDGKLDDISKKRYFEALKFQAKYGEKKKFYTSDLGQNISMGTIEAEYEKVLQIFKPQLIVIDYLGKMKAINPTGQDWLDQGSVAADMYEFAKGLKDTPVLSASQMKSAVRTNSGLKRFEGDVENISRSKMIGDNLSMNLQIVKDELYNQSEYMEVIISKCRDGETGGSFTLVKEFWRQTVCDPAQPDFNISGIDAAAGL